MLNLFKQRGLTLVELIMVMVVLAIGLSGVLMVMISMTSFSMVPITSWQAAMIADNVMQNLLIEEFTGFEDCIKENTTLCQYRNNTQKVPADQLLKKMNAVKSIADYSVIIEISPYQHDLQMAQITVLVEHPFSGKMMLTALKAPKYLGQSIS